MDIAEIRKKAKKARESKDRDILKPEQSSHDVPAGEKEKGHEEVSIPAFPDKAETSPGLPRELTIPTEKIYNKSLEPEKVTEETIRVLTFFLNEEEYALEVAVIKEIIKPRELTEVPNSPSFVPGIISLRGEVTPVVDLRKRLKLEAKDIGRKGRIVVTIEEDKKVGLIVDSVTQVAKIAKKEIEPSPSFQEGIDIEFINGICHHQKRLIILLNLSKVLEW